MLSSLLFDLVESITDSVRQLSDRGINVKKKISHRNEETKEEAITYGLKKK